MESLTAQTSEDARMTVAGWCEWLMQLARRLVVFLLLGNGVASVILLVVLLRANKELRLQSNACVLAFVLEVE